MKKRKTAITIALVSALAITPTLAACSSDNFSAVDFPRDQNTAYAVTSQGGSAVAYGNYVYFINGTRGYDDAKGESNRWGEVVKGGLYRAKLVEDTDAQYADDLKYKGFTPKLDVDAGLEFKYTAETDYFDKPINTVDVTKIAPKTIGTSGYAKGGIFIYDDFIYFASPNNSQNASGTIQTTSTDFFMMSLKKKNAPVKVYTTSEGVDTSASEYAFYKLGGAVYLVVKEGGNIVSVKINPKDEDADDPVTFKVKASSVYFPVRDTYYKGIDNNTVEDFIYFVRPVNDKDSVRTGTVIEAMRPDGSDKFIVSANGKTETIEAVRDGVFFRRTQNMFNETVIAYDNLREQRYEYSAAYRKQQDKLLADDSTKDQADRHIHGEFSTAISSDITATYAFRPNDDAQSNEVCFVAVTESAMYRYGKDGNAEVLYSGATGTPLFDNAGYLYYSGSSSDFYRVALFDNFDNDYDDAGALKPLAKNTTSAGISCDYVEGYFTYFGDVDQWASAYTYFYKVDGYEGLEPQFVGKRAKADIPTEKQIEEAKK